MEKLLKELRDKRDKAIADSKAIVKAAKENGGLSDEDREKIDALTAEIDDCKAKIDETVADMDRIEKIEDAAEQAANPPVENQRQHREDPNAGTPARTNARVVERNQNENGFNNFGEFLVSVVRAETNMGRDARLIFEEPRADAPGLGQNTVIPSSGGYLLPTGFSTMLLDAMMAESLLLNRLNRVPMTVGNSIKMPYVQNSSRAAGYRFGGVRCYRRQQGDTVDPSKIKWGELTVGLKDLMGVGYVTDEMLQDAVFTGTVLQQAFSSEMSFVAEDEVINGKGQAEALGMLNAPCLVTVAKESGQAADTINGNNIVEMWARLPARLRRNAIWLYNQELEPQLPGLSILSTAVKGATTATAAIPLVMPAGTGINKTDFSTIFNRPMLPMEQCSAPGDVGDIILCDPTQYLWTEKGGITTATSMHVRFLYNEQCFRITYRCDGQPAWPSSVTPFKGNKSIGPFIVVAARG